MRNPRRTWILGGVLLGLVLHGAAGWWSATGLAQGGSTNITTTNSTTTGTTFQSPPDCSPVGSSFTEISVTTGSVIGPGTILIGPEQSVTFFVEPGTLNINTNTHTQTFPCVAAVPAVPWHALFGVGTTLGALGAWNIRRRRRRT